MKKLWCIENLFIDEQNDELGDILRFSGTFYFFQRSQKLIETEVIYVIIKNHLK